LAYAVKFTPAILTPQQLCLRLPTLDQ
jgi:hypothetical protein